MKNDIFHKNYPQFQNSNEFRNNFRDLNFIRNFVAHKRSRKINILEFLDQTQFKLSDILEKFYNCVTPLIKI